MWVCNVVYQVALSLQQWRYVTVLSGLALWERYQPNLDSQQSTCSSRTSAKQSSRAVLALLQLLTQDIHKGNVSSPPVVFVLMPSGSLAVFSLILNFVTGGLARLQIHEHPQSETRTMSNSHFNLPVQFTHTKDQQNLVSSASSLLFFVFISLFVSVFPGFILTRTPGIVKCNNPLKLNPFGLV